jgi:hypothetical protein
LVRKLADGLRRAIADRLRDCYLVANLKRSVPPKRNRNFVVRFGANCQFPGECQS